MRRTKKVKRILLLFCGGTISMKKNKDTGSLDIAHGSEQFFQLEPRIGELANITVKFIDNIDSTNMTHKQWEKLVREIEKNYDKFDGFLVTMGTNTLGYASSALSFALAGIGKPVVFTGAQIPAEIISTDARNNLVNALRVATMDLGGVFVVFGSKLILGCRAKKVSESELDAFKTFNDSDFGEIAIGIKINKTTHRGHHKKFKARNGFVDNIVCLTLIPGLSGKYITKLVDSGVKGLILRAYGSGDIPYDMLDALQYAKKRNVPVVVTTQCPGGATIMGLNDVGLQALHTGVIQAFDMSMESMSTKLMWLVAQKIPFEALKKKMHTNMVGEVSSRNAEVFLSMELDS